MAAAGRVRTAARAPQPRRVPPVRRPAPALLQPLRVGAVNDPAEREAEAAAARIAAAATTSLDAPPPRSGAAPGPGTGPGAARPPERRAPQAARSADNQPNLDELTEPPLPAAQADIEVAPEQQVPLDNVTPDDTAELDSGTPADTGGEPPAPDLPPIEDAPPPLPRAASDAAPAAGGRDGGPAAAAGRDGSSAAVVGRDGGPAPADVAARVASPGPGAPLPPAIAARAGAHFGRDFAEVRVHAAPADRAAAARIGARAFTHGRDIWLGQGESPHDLRLMAHELTHVDQQTDPPEGRQAGPARRDAALRRASLADDEAESLLRHVPGYALATVILGRRIVSGERVEMTAENLVGGLLGLVIGGTTIFDRLREARAVQEAFDWLRARLTELNLTWSRVSALLGRAWDAVLSFNPLANLAALFRPIFDDLVRFVGAVTAKILEFVVRGALRLAGPHADRVWGIIAQARESLGLILEDPAGFARNLIRAVVGGFQRFGANILDHLKRGLLGWLFGALSSAGITLPDRLDFRGLLSLVLQVLGLTYQAFRARLVRALGPSGERKVAMIERSVEVVRMLVTEGFLGLWQKLVGMVENFRQTLLGGMQEMVIGTVIRAGIRWLAGLTNPVGALVRVVSSIYDMIVAFLDRIEQIMQVAQSIFTSIGAIARGQVEQAIAFVEQTMGRAVPVVITFLAALLGLGDLPRRIQEVLRRIRRPIEAALDRLIRFLLRHAQRLLARLIGRINGIRRLPSYNFRVGRTQHRLFLKRVGRGVAVFVNPAPERPLPQAEAANARELPRIPDAAARAEASELNQAAEATDRSTTRNSRIVDLASQTQNQFAFLSRLDTALREAAQQLGVEGANIDSFPAMSSRTNEGFFRAAEPRDAAFEGSTGNYNDLQGQAGRNSSRSRFYNLDHTIEKRFPKAILENLHLIDPARAAARLNDPVVRVDTRRARGEAQGAGRRTATRADADAPPFGRIGGTISRIDEPASHFPAIAVYHRDHLASKGRGLPSHEQVIALARQAPDPHAELRRLIARQLDAELGEMTTAFANDTATTPAIQERVRAGLADLRARHEEVYAAGAAGQPPRPATPATAAAPGASTTTTYEFGGGGGAPDFLAEEGVSGAFRSLPDGRGNFFQRDHIIDQAYPGLVRDSPLLAAAQRGAVAGRVGPGLDAAQQGRLDALARTPIFPEGHPIRAYTEASGFAVTLHRPIALEVTHRTPSAPRTDAALVVADGGTLGKMADHVRTRDASALNEARRGLHASIQTQFVRRAELHAGHAADLYGAEIEQVANLNSAANGQAARSNMARIGTRVRDSLVAARNATAALFPD